MNDPVNEGWTGGITGDDVRAVWDGQIQPIAGDLVASNASPATRQFLTQVGLPIVEVLGVSFATDERLSETEQQHGRELLIVTDAESAMSFAVDVRSEQVFQIDPALPRYIRFFNSDLAALVFFFGALNKEVLSRQELTDEIFEDAMDGVRAQLSARDPAAMEGESAWNALLDDIEAQYSFG
jgi:hypothetical protein